MLILKRAENVRRFARPSISFPNARTAFKALLKSLDLSPEDEILLPAYIGWSKAEGSGVFDPIREVGVKHRFYRVTRQLAIDFDDLRGQIASGHPRLLLIIHYFGYPDRNLADIAEYARNHGVLVVEDEAHALYSDWIGGICGRSGDAAIISLHKMLPFASGGLLILNDPVDASVRANAQCSALRVPLEGNPLDYDLASISRARRRNALELANLLRPLQARVTPLFSQLPDGVIPQTLPVIITDRSRDDLYFRLNELGFGVVSLYHTLITSIPDSEFPDSHWLARRILNLPVHQDVPPGALEAMVAQLERLLC